MPPAMELRFEQAMLSIYKRAKAECNYNATRFLQMIDEMGGVQTAKALLHAPGLSDGFTAMWELHRLDLTMEALILEPVWHALFSDEEREIAEKRLSDLGFTLNKLP